MRGAEIHGRELEVAADRGQQVVEVVGDAAGQRAHRLHLLRLPELGLEPLPRLFSTPTIGDVDAGADVADEGARRVEARDAVRRHPAILAIGAARAGIDLEGLLRLERTVLHGGPGLPVVGMQELVPAVGRHVVDLTAEEGDPPLVDEHRLTVGVGGPYHHRRCVREHAEALFAVAQLGVGVLALGDVDHHAAQRHRASLDDVDGHAILQPDDAPIGSDHPVVELVVAAGFGALDAVADRGVAVRWMNVRRPEARIVQPGADRIAEQALGLGADEGEAERGGVGLPDDAVDGGDEAGQVGASQPRAFVGLDHDRDVLDEEHDAADRPRRIEPGLHLPAHPDERLIREGLDPLALDTSRFAGEAAPVRRAPVLGQIGIDLVMRTADEIDASRCVSSLPPAVDREVAHLAIQHRQRARRVIEEELQPLLALAQAADDPLGLRLALAVAHRSSIGQGRSPGWWGPALMERASIWSNAGAG